MMENLHHARWMAKARTDFLASSLCLKQTDQCCVSAVILEYFTLSPGFLLFLQQNYFASWPQVLYCIGMLPFTSQLGYDVPMKEKLQHMHDPVPASVLYHHVTAGSSRSGRPANDPSPIVTLTGGGRKPDQWRMQPSLS